MIDAFEGPHRFLSNFFPVCIVLDGVAYPTLEHAYQASKFIEPKFRQIFLAGRPGEAKARARELKEHERPDWFEINLGVMESLLRQKFAKPALKMMLMNTKGHPLIEGNHWHDNFWGVCYCERCKRKDQGQNHLGKLLEKLRAEYLSEAQKETAHAQG